MKHLITGSILLLVFATGFETRRVCAQISLADDIIIAAQGRENAELNEENSLGRTPGTAASPYRRSPGSSEIILGVNATRRLAPLPRLTRRPTSPDELSTPGQERDGVEHGLAPAVERLPGTSLSPSAHLLGSSSERETTPDDEGPANGLTLDAAIQRLVWCNRELRTKFLEIPQADADILTAGLRSNPLLFYSSDNIPYGSYSQRRPGELEHGLSIVFPFDFSGKRRARVAVAKREKQVLEAQYWDAVRLEIDNLYTAYVDVLSARQAVRAAERSEKLLGDLLRDVQTKGRHGPHEEDDIDDLTIEHDVSAMSTGDERDRYRKSKQRLAHLLAVSPAEAEHLELRGSLRVLEPHPPAVETLISMALEYRPDLAAHRHGINRAHAELKQESAERFSDAYFLYTPFDHRDNSHVGEESVNTWGAGLFVSVPLFNRNQGNLKRARINIDQSQNELTALEEQAVLEVQQAYQDFENTHSDALRLEQVTLPAVRRKRDKAWRKLHAGTLTADAFLAVQRDSSSLVRYYRDTLSRHRRNTLKLNTSVGVRILP